MGNLVIDEWLWSDLARENGVERQVQATQFLNAVFKRCDKLVTVRGSAFDAKARALWQHTDLVRRTIARIYNDQFAYNSEKNVILEQSDLPELDPGVVADVESSDHYLIQAHKAAQAELIVTTDSPLIGVLEKHGIAHQHRETFVPDYVTKYG
jgi:hypothetical protein